MSDIHAEDLSDLSLANFHQCPGCNCLVRNDEERCFNRTEDPVARAAWGHKAIENTITRDRSHHPRNEP